MDEDHALFLSCVQEEEESDMNVIREESHDPDWPIKTGIGDSLECPICGKILQTASGMRRHKKRHSAQGLAGGQPKAEATKGKVNTGMEHKKKSSVLKGSDPPKSSEASHALNIAVARRALQNISYGRVEATRRIRVPETVKVSKKRPRVSACHDKGKVSRHSLAAATRRSHGNQVSSASLKGDDTGMEDVDSEDPMKLSAMEYAANNTDTSSQSKLNPVEDGWNILFSESFEQAPLKPLTLRANHHEGSDEKESSGHQISMVSTSKSDRELRTEGNITGNERDLDTLLGQRMWSAQPVLTKLAGTAALLQEGIIKLLKNHETESVNREEAGTSSLLRVSAEQRRRFSSRLKVCLTRLKTKKAHSGVWNNRVWKKHKGSERRYDEKSDVNTTGKNTTSCQNTVKRRRNRKKAPTFCEICQKDFANLKKHNLVHNSTRSFKCEECNKAFYEKRVLEKHQMTHIKKYKCTFCGEMFSKVRAANRHARTHLPDKPYICEICNHHSPSRRELRKHMVLHSEYKRFICDTCGHASHTKGALSTHQKSHTDRKPYVCEKCGKAFKYSSGLRVHSFVHTSGKPYRCVLCGESFAHNYLLKRHRSMHKEQSSSGGAGMLVQNSTPIAETLSDTRAEQEMDLPDTILDDANMFNATFGVCSDETQPASIVQESAENVSSETVPDICVDPCVNQKLGNIKGAKSHSDSKHNASLMRKQTSAGSGATNSRGRKAPRVAVFGKDLLKQNLTYGQGSRKQTLENSFVVPLCDGSFKALKDLQKRGENVEGLS